jgi:hypothetical protein
MSDQQRIEIECRNCGVTIGCVPWIEWVKCGLCGTVMEVTPHAPHVDGATERSRHDEDRSVDG